MGEQPVAVSFSGHETFPFRYAWMKKGLDAIADDRLIFTKDEAMTRLGVGKNMVRSIRHWCIAAGLLEEEKSLFPGRGAGLVRFILVARLDSPGPSFLAGRSA